MPNESSDLRRDYFVALRNEIDQTRARIFRIFMVALIGIPVMFYFVATGTSRWLVLLAPLVVLLLLVMYLSEQTMLMRAAGYIREKVEASDDDWQHWISTKGMYAAARQLFAMFVVIGLFIYVLLLRLAISELMQINADIEAGWYSYYFDKYGVMLMYGVATLWALVTLTRFWRSAVTAD